MNRASIEKEFDEKFSVRRGPNGEQYPISTSTILLKSFLFEKIAEVLEEKADTFVFADGMSMAYKGVQVRDALRSLASSYKQPQP